MRIITYRLVTSYYFPFDIDSFLLFSYLGFFCSIRCEAETQYLGLGVEMEIRNGGHKSSGVNLKIKSK